MLDGGSSLTFELDTSGLEAELRSKWVEGFDGDGAVAPDGSKISLTFRVGAYDPKEKCYLTHSGKSCLLLLEGENVALYWGFYNTMNGLTRLNQAGELEGVISYMDYGNDRGAVPVRVNLMN